MAERYGRIAERRLATQAVVQEGKIERDAAKAEAFTFRAMVERWRKEHLAPKRSPGYAAEAERALLVSFAGWKDRAAQSIASAEASDALNTIREERGPAAASHAFRYAHAAFNWAERRELVSSNPMARAVTPEKSRARDRALTDAELGTVWRAAAKLGPPFDAMFQLLILTLQRRSEVAGMRWSEISEDGRLWTLPGAQTKNAQRHIVHLSPTAQAAIEAIPRFRKSDLVFTTTGKTPVSGFSRAKQRLDEQGKTPATDRAPLSQDGGSSTYPYANRGRCLSPDSCPNQPWDLSAISYAKIRLFVAMRSSSVSMP